MRSLRVEGRPGRARALLDQYLGRFPSGALAEDATALEIEAAAAAGEVAAARRWATRYLAAFPSGRFRAAADRALRADSPKGAVVPHP
jgi:hypothetical protein